VHDVGPQLTTALLSTHLPSQTWNPLLQIRAQAPPTQAAVPFGSVAQGTQVAPQPVGSLSGEQRVAQRWWPTPQMKSHDIPLQVESLAPVGFGHAAHDVGPQEFTLVFAAQRPLQSCEPAAHCPEHAITISMHAPAHSFMPVGQAGTHAAPSQLTVPPVGA